MAETLISPGILATENDQSQITSQPLQAGAAIVGPTVKGQVNIPKIVTTYSEYQANFGTTFDSGSDEYTFLTSIAAYNYFQNGGTSLIVTKVANGTFTSATSSMVTNNQDEGNLLSGTTLTTSTGGSGGTVGSQTLITPTSTSGGGTGATIAYTKTFDNGKLIVGNPIAVSTNPTGLTDGPYTVNASGGDGSGATFDIIVSGGGVTTATIATAGLGFNIGNQLTLDVSGITGAGAQICDLVALTQNELLAEVTSISVDTSGTGYADTDTITLASGLMNGGTELVISLTANDIVGGNSFTLETIGEGTIMNNTGAENANGALGLGTSDNIRWEVQSPNTANGTFSLVVRRGNDRSNRKSVLESYNNLSLDPKSPNYIARIIGDQKQSVVGSGADAYIQTSGQFPNASRFIRVKEVLAKTPSYLDNSGVAKDAYTGSIPVAASGTFGDATGNVVTGTGKYYESISQADTQGLVASDYDVAFSLLANKDEYKFNIITAPGLIQSMHTSTLNTLISNTENRGDNIAVLDLEGYGSSVSAITTTANSLDTSYAASYWPWCMTTDPDTGRQVWVPASVMIPGVYANNDKTAEAWFAPAGINRGGLGNVTQAERKLSQSNRDALYQNKVNPIATFPGRGVVVFGQKTLQQQASALDRVNVRRLLIALKTYISGVSDNLVFEQNTTATRNVFLSQVNPYLESVQQRQGLYAFKVVMDDSNNGPDVIDKNELKGAIYVQPTKTAEFIYLDFNILPTGAEFPA